MENLTAAQRLIKNHLSSLEKNVEHIEVYKEEICLFSDEEIKQIKEKLQNAICYIESIIDEIEDI